jgi:creatinine amidohydrolase/Fe(II)-dependent formamide hydrolase-like protein
MQAFALNDEALINFAYASYKKVHDVAVTLMRRRYGRPPRRVYYVGSSEGGREGLTMAQRFPTDYDGVISRVPVINWTALQHAGWRSGIVQQNGGWLDSAKVALFGRAVLAACDSLDGLADGIVSDYLGCRATFRIEPLRCSSATGDACLSDPQIAAMTALHSPYVFPFALASDVRAYPAFGFGGETQTGGFSAWITGRSPASADATARGQGLEWVFGNGAVRYFVMRDGKANPLTYSPEAYADRVRQISDLMDSMNPDLSAFARRGGKLIVKEHLADYAQSPFAGVEYYESVVKRMGREAVDRFARLYVTPGVGHGGRGVSATTGEDIPSYVDLLGALDAWVERGRAPDKSLIQTSAEPRPPFTVHASRPMCSYPQYPRYMGAGDPKLAASFPCVTTESPQTPAAPSRRDDSEVARGSVRISTLPWTEAAALLDSSTVVMIPLGAESKEHGPHLPLNNDWLLAEYFAARVMAATRVVVYPTINYNFYPAFLEYPGSTSLRLETARDLIVDIVRSIARHGPRRFYILNTGVSTRRALAPARDSLAASGIVMAYTDILNVGHDAEVRVRQQEGGTHADEIETSLMLYMHPDLVRMDRAPNDYHPGAGALTRDSAAAVRDGKTWSRTGTFGNATLATREKGRLLVEAQVRDMVAEVERLRRAPIP